MKKLFVFDLDFTLWNAGDTWCDCTLPPYKWSNDKLLDHSGSWIRLYNDVIEILQSLKNSNKIIAAASRTNAPEIALELLSLLKIDHYFDAMEIYPGDKQRHLSKIIKQTSVPERQVVFFDDEYRNIQSVSSMGVESIFIDDGINWEIIQPYINESSF